MSNYLSQIAQRTAPAGGDSPSARAPLLPPASPAPGAATDIVEETVTDQPTTHVAPNTPQPSQTQRTPRVNPTEPESDQQTFEKTTPLPTVRYLERRLQWAPVQQPTWPRTLPRPATRQGQAKEIPAVDQNSKHDQKNTITAKMSEETASARPPAIQHLPVVIPTSIQEEKDRTKSAQTSSDLTGTTLDRVLPPPVKPATTPVPVPANPPEQVSRTRKSPPLPKLSIGRLTVEVVTPPDKGQTKQKIIHRVSPPAGPKAGSPMANKLIFGFGQL